MFVSVIDVLKNSTGEKNCIQNNCMQSICEEKVNSNVSNEFVDYNEPNDSHVGAYSGEPASDDPFDDESIPALLQED